MSGAHTEGLKGVANINEGLRNFRLFQNFARVSAGSCFYPRVGSGLDLSINIGELRTSFLLDRTRVLFLG